MTEETIHIFTNALAIPGWIDTADNVETAVSILYGDMSEHDGQQRIIFASDELVSQMEYEARINADCWGIPVDVVQNIDEMPERYEKQVGNYAL